MQFRIFFFYTHRQMNWTEVHLILSGWGLKHSKCRMFSSGMAQGRGFNVLYPHKKKKLNPAPSCKLCAALWWLWYLPLIKQIQPLWGFFFCFSLWLLHNSLYSETQTRHKKGVSNPSCTASLWAEARSISSSYWLGPTLP